MEYKILDTCKNIDTIQPEDVPIFSNNQWYIDLEKSICNNTSTPYIITITDNKNQHTIPMTESSNKNIRRLKCMANYYTPFYKLVSSLIITDEIHHNIISTCSDSLLNFHTIDIAPIYTEDAEIWSKSLSSIGFKCHTYQHSTNWYHDNILSVDQYWSLRPDKLIKIIENKKNKLKKIGGYKTVINRANDINELQIKLSHYHHIYYESWKKLEPHPYFIDSICQHAWKNNKLRIGITYHHDFPVAAQIWFINNSTAYIFKLAHRHSYRKNSIGTLLTEKMINHVIDTDKVNCIDFLTGDDNFKKDWMQSNRPLMGVQACNPKTWQGKVFETINKLSVLRKKTSPLKPTNQ